MTTPPNAPNLIGLQKAISDRLMYRRQKAAGPIVERKINNKSQKIIDRKKGLQNAISNEDSTDTSVFSLWNVLRLLNNDESGRSVTTLETLCNTARTAETLTSRDSRNLTKSSDMSTNDVEYLNFDYSDFVDELIRKSQSTLSRYDDENDVDECSSVDSDEEVVSCKLNHYIIHWSDISFPSHTPSNKIIIGKGSYGTVLRALWTKDGNEKEVAIKIQTIPNTKTKSDFHKVRCQTKREVQVMITARDHVPDKSVVTEAYGMIEGSLPPQIATLLKRTNPDDKAVGIVMEYESGGSLEQYLSRKSKSTSSSSKKINLIPLKEKFRLLVEISRSIHALHSVGIVHADIKAANVLLSGDILHPRPRLSDFGMSVFRQEVNIFEPRLSVQMTSKRSRGTRAFCAPEMLVNPYKQGMLKTNMMGDKEAADFLNTIAKPSRTTDMYAFGLLAWQILSQRQPFAEITSEAMLVSKVHKDYRPDVSKCPPETPNEVISMIQSCWHGDREKRKTAGECFAILERHYFSLPYTNPTDESSLNITGTNSLMSSQESDISSTAADMSWATAVTATDQNLSDDRLSSSVFTRHVINQLLLQDDDDDDDSNRNKKNMLKAHHEKNGDNNNNQNQNQFKPAVVAEKLSSTQAPFLSRIKRLSKTNGNNNHEQKSQCSEFENYLSDFSENDDDDVSNGNHSNQNSYHEKSNNNSNHSNTQGYDPSESSSSSSMIEVKKQSSFVSKNITFFNSLRLSPTVIKKSLQGINDVNLRRASSFHPTNNHHNITVNDNSNSRNTLSADYRNMTNYNFASSSSSSSSASSVKSIVAAINAGRNAVAVAVSGNGSSRSTNTSPCPRSHKTLNNDGMNNLPPFPEHLQRPQNSGNTTIRYTTNDFSSSAATSSSSTATTILTPEQVLEREQHQYDLMRTSFRGNALVAKRPVSVSSAASSSSSGSRSVSRSTSSSKLNSTSENNNNTI